MKTERTAFTLIELLVVIAIIALLIGILLPAIGKARDSGLILQSMDNLRNFGAAHAVYASEWNGRQWTTCPDDLTVILDVHSGGSYQRNYGNLRDLVPPAPLGFDRYGNHHETSEGWAIQPKWWTGNCSVGSFRLFHTKPFNQYINGKVYDPIFWAPKDNIVNDRIRQWMDDPGEWPAEDSGHGGEGENLTLIISTYATSVAAAVAPEVYSRTRPPMIRARQRAAGHRAPNLSSARYPDLKSHMVEHRWLQNPPSTDIPGSPGVPWFYNFGADSTPATLFYDSSVRMVSTREAVQSSKRVQAQGEEPLDACDPDCFGCNGYFENHAYGGDQDAINSWHVFTRDGINGRDFVMSGG